MPLPHALADVRLGDLLSAIASREPTPGGGAVAGVAAALAAALAEMVLAFSEGGRRAEGRGAELADAREQLGRARAALLRLGEEDAAGYAALSAATALPKADVARPARVSSAAALATEPPLAVMAVCARVLELLVELAPASNRHLASDLRAAAVLAEASSRAAGFMVGANLPLIADQARRAGIEAQARQLAGSCAALASGLLAAT